MSANGEDENQEDPGYKTYLQPISVPTPGVEVPAPSAEPPPQAPPEPALPELEDEEDEEDEEAAVYKTYVQPLRVPPARAEPPPPPPAPDPPAAAIPAPPPQEAPREPESPPPPPVATQPPPVAPRPAGHDFKNFEFRKAGQVGRGRRVVGRVVAAVVVAVGLALAYPLVNPFGSSSGSSLTRYMQGFQPIATRADQDRRNVQAAVNAVRQNPKGRTAAARRLAVANRDRQTLIQRLTALGPAPGLARALPGRLTRLLQIQVATGRVWQRWMLHRPFVYLKDDRTTRTRIQSLLKSQQASKGAFTRLYSQLLRTSR